jgi:hypothetical protein
MMDPYVHAASIVTAQREKNRVEFILSDSFESAPPAFVFALIRGRQHGAYELQQAARMRPIRPIQIVRRPFNNRE